MNPIDTHIAAHPAAVQTRLQAIRETIAAEAPQAVETLSYGIPTFDLQQRHLVHFAGFAHHIGFYPGADGIAAHEALLQPYKRAKGSVQFPHDQPLPLDIVRTITRFRIAAVAQELARKRRAPPVSDG